MNPEIISSLQTQLSQRLEKLWNVFSWCSGILISIIGAVLFVNRLGGVALQVKECLIISLVIVILTAYAYFWLDENLGFEKKVRDEIDRIFETEFKDTRMKSLRPDKAKFGYKAVILLLGSTALVATWLNIFSP